MAGKSSFIVPLPEEGSVMEPLSQTEPFRFPVDAAPNHSTRPKVVHDRIHDQMIFHPVIVRIIDTPEFQRLRELHQLGNGRYVFPGATHSRFEHSLGVCHLAMKFAKQLKSNHEEMGPELHITKNDILCVGIAGLCHDLGHGPLSHMFEDFVNDMRERNGTISTKGKWHHETASSQMLDHLLIHNKIDVTDYDLTQEDINFVHKLIAGLKPNEDWPTNINRDKSKRFLFDIVANKRNGIDVDKLDYFLRDSMSCYGKLPDIHVDRILTCARVITSDNQTQICFEEKVALSLGELFNLRVRLHKFVYQHRVVKVLDQMILDALMAADDHFFITKANGGKCKLSESVEDMTAYVKTGDWIISAIEATEDPQLAKARQIISRIRSRELYRMVGCYLFQPSRNIVPTVVSPMTPVSLKSGAKQQSHHTIIKGLVTAEDLLRYVPADSQTQVTEDDIFISRTKIMIGSSDSKEAVDPTTNVRFFNPKKDPNKAQKLSNNHVSPLFAPRAYEENTAFVFCRNDDFHVTSILYAAFQEWFKGAKASGHAQEPTPFVNASPAPHMRTGGKRPREEEDSNSMPIPPTSPPRFRLHEQE